MALVLRKVRAAVELPPPGPRPRSLSQLLAETGIEPSLSARRAGRERVPVVTRQRDRDSRGAGLAFRQWRDCECWTG